MVAGTIVVREDVIAQPMVPDRAAGFSSAADAPRLHAALTAEEFDLLERFMQRQRDFTPERRAHFAHSLAVRLAPALTDYQLPSEAGRLGRLYTAERAARAAGSASRHDTGAARERHAIVARESARWAGFAVKLAAAQRKGLGSARRGGSAASLSRSIATWRPTSRACVRRRAGE